jgi:hypothetical protein
MLCYVITKAPACEIISLPNERSLPESKVTSASMCMCMCMYVTFLGLKEREDCKGFGIPCKPNVVRVTVYIREEK